MQDPKVVELVDKFYKDVEALNKTWATLHKNDVFVRLEIKGQSTYTEPKYIVVDTVTQHVQYANPKLKVTEENV